MKNKYENTYQNKYVTYQDFIGSAEARHNMIANMNLMDDVLFAVTMEDTKACEYVLREITGIKTLHVVSSKAQFSVYNLTSHSVILDVIAEDDTGQLFNIEIQKSNNDHHPKRIRYYQANVDTTFLSKGIKYENLPEAWFIFISDFDPFNLGDNYYEIERKIKGRDSHVNNGIHEVYLNTKIINERGITRLLQYFKDTDAANDEFGALSERIRFIKDNSKGGNTYMSEQLRILIEGACEAKDKIISEQAKELNNKDTVIQNKDIELQTKDAEIAALKAQIAAMQKTG